MDQNCTARLQSAGAGYPLLILCLVCPLLSALTACKTPEEKLVQGRPPNIVIVMADDLGYGDPGCYNPQSAIPTPHIDRLAREGMRFTDAHTPSSVCTPTRYGLLTGRYSWRTRLKSGVLWGYSPALIETNRLTIASLLKNHGYTTAGVGKWHLGLGNEKKTDYSQPLRPGPVTAGFEQYFGIPASLDMDPYLYLRDDRPVEMPNEHIDASQMRRSGGAGFWRAGAISPDFNHMEVLPTVTREAVRFLDEHGATASSKPFFLYFPLTAPHTPWLPTTKFQGSSKAGPYGDFVAQVDSSLGDVLAALERNDFSDNTLFVFTSDNGAHWTPTDKEQYPHRANGPWRGQKADIWEGGHRVPFIAKWPGVIRAGSVSTQTICLTDLFATVAATVGENLPPNAGEDSFNLLPILAEEQTQPVREAIVHHSLSGMFAIREGNWKLILERGSGGFSSPRRLDPQPGEPEGQLYNLEKDPGENDNLYLRHPEKVQHLKSLLERYRKGGRSASPINGSELSKNPA